jgi:hypothetical protein
MVFMMADLVMHGRMGGPKEANLAGYVTYCVVARPIHQDQRCGLDLVSSNIGMSMGSVGIIGGLS